MRRVQRTRWFFLLVVAVALVVSAPAKAAACGKDPGRPKALSLTTCDARGLRAGVVHLLAVYSYASCKLFGSKQAEPARKRDLAAAVSYLKDKGLAAHVAKCGEAASVRTGTQPGSGR